MNAEDAALVERCRCGDRHAVQALVDRYQRPVFNAAYRILGNREDAADATQTAFMKVFENLESYDAQYKLFSWIYRIVVNESISQFQRNGASRALTYNEESWGGDDELERQVDSAVLSRRTQASLMALPEEYRVVLVLRHFSECSYEQIGEILELPEKTIKSRIYIARQQLKKLLVANGVNWE
ncbi:RNA polymerase sigma factor [Haliea sp. E17]|uniref:RNA polymerase sigma factor n=1 Tax=Haliea sp. E17 TaxID=3401576 RepID=UPI003AB02D96